MPPGSLANSFQPIPSFASKTIIAEAARESGDYKQRIFDMKRSMLAAPPMRRSSLGLVALLFAVQCCPVHAIEIDDAAKSNVASSPQAEVPWISGGVGDDAMAEMHKASAGYNVHLMLTGPRGNYLAGVPFTVSRRGQSLVSGVTEGPLLYLKLPAGNYQISVDTDGVRQSRNIRVAASGPATKLRFVSRSE